MDSLTQIALGAAVGEAVMNHRIGRKASLWGAICGTLPDLDVLIPMGDAVKDFTYHRAESHSLFYMALVTPLLVWLILKIYPETKKYRKQWFILVILSFFTHSILDSFTVYGTQMFLPFSNFPVSWSTIFVIDPLYTLPLLIGLFLLFRNKTNLKKGYILNILGLLVSSLYLIWSVSIKLHVHSVAKESLQSQDVSITKMISSPAPFNTILWRVVGMQDSGYIEGFYSLFDENQIQFKTYSSENTLLHPIENQWSVKRLKWFTNGFYKVSKNESKIIMTDIRMGVEPLYFFNFSVGEVRNGQIIPGSNEKLNQTSFNMPNSLLKLWTRIWDED